MHRSAALAALLTTAALAQPKLAIEHYELPNGLQVILHVDRKTPSVQLNLRYHVGSRDERPGRFGFAHLFEHIMLEGDADFQTAADRLGATGVNAFTYPDYTEYVEQVPSSRLERILWMESGRLSSLLDTLTQQKFDKHREVVRNELRQKIENEPYKRINIPLFQYVFPAGHPYQHSPIGSHEDLLAASLDDVRSFYHEHYTVDNLALVLAGDFEPAQARQWIATYFGPLPPGQTGAVPPERSTPQLAHPKLVELTDRVPNEQILFAWPAAGAASPHAAALEMAAFILNDAAGGLDVAVKHGVCKFASPEQYWFRDASIFLIGTGPAEGKSVADVDGAIAAVLARFAREGPSEDELTRARNNLEFQQIGKLDNLYELAATLNHVQHYYGSVDRFPEWAGRYGRVTAQSIRDAVSRWLVTPNRLAIHVIPAKAVTPAAPAPDRKQPPPFGPDKPYRFPEVKTATLPNGLQILVVERHELPEVSVDFRLRLGPALNPPGKPGVALLSIATSGFGTTTRSRDEIEKTAKRLAAAIHASDDGGSQSAGFEVLRANLDEAMALLADVIRRPTYPEKSFEDQKQEFVDDYEKAANRIDNFQWPAVTIAFGKSHPIGAAMGTAESRRSVTRKDAQEFHDRYWKPDISALAFAGDITLDEAVALATKNFGDWTGHSEPAPPMPAPQPMPGRLFLIDRSGATQTHVVELLPGIPLAHPDFAALLLVNRVGGGIYSSRLNIKIRRDKGISYGAGSELQTFSGTGMWLARSIVQLDNTRQAVSEFLKELRGIAGEKPITAEELETARESFLRSYPGDLETVAGISRRLTMNWAWGLPMGNIQDFPRQIAAVTLQQANLVARKYALVDRAKFLLIGDRSKIEPGLKDLGLGSPTIMQ
jgi:zinc protease